MTDVKPSALDAGTVKIGSFTVHRMGYGAMRITGPGIWGPPHDASNAKRVLERAVELGGNFIDTADAYGPETSEELIHDALYPYEGMIIATKGGMLRGGPGDWRPDGSPQHLREACEASLKRLELDRITLYQLHHPDPAVPFEESVAELIKLQKEGKIRYIGLSNVNLDQLKQALAMTRIVSVRNRYNFEERRDSEEIVDFCTDKSIAFIPYFPVGGSRSVLDAPALLAVADKHQATPHQIALAWLLARSPIILPIPGTASLEHLVENIAAGSIKLDEDDLRNLDKLSD